ncbi:MAG: insulinase family protein [Burkholderiales bacterium]|nr:insulinase family protein [Burkholderiales bacterium]
MLRRILSLTLALLLPGFLFAPAHATPASTQAAASISKITSVEGITEYRLENGLKVLLFPDATQDTVTVNLTYLVGSRNEGYGEYGMAHLLEHMQFKGTPRHPDPKNEFQGRGARFNASTSFDRTNYYENLAASESNLDWALELEADRMLNSTILKKDLDSEMTVVRNEFEAGENSPHNVLGERMASAAYLWHNYGHAIIGSRSDIENVPIERLQAFYRKYYQPDNAVLLVSGKFDEAAALKMVERHFAGLPRPARALIPTYTAEPTQDGERSVTLRRAGEIQLVGALYHLPPGAHADFPAIDVLVTALTKVPGGRLHRALVESGKASSVYGGDQQLREAGYAYFGASLGKDLSLDAARAALLTTLEGFASKPITDEEVERARTQLLNDIEMALANPRELGIALSEFIAMGDWRLFFLYRDGLKKLTPADVQRVATQYLKTSNRTLGMFVPSAQPDRAEIPPAPDVAALVRDYKGAAPVAAGESFEPSAANIDARTTVRQLPGGMKLALLPKKTRGGTVVAQLVLHWGDEQSKMGRSSACRLASAMLMRGTRKHTREQLRDEFDRLKANVSVSGNGASIETLGANLPAVLRLVTEVLREPAFPESEFTQLKRSALTSVESMKSEPGALAGLQLARHLNPYPPEHWLYTPTLDERMQRLQSVGIEDMRRCHDDFYGASNSELAVVGDFDAAQITGLAQELFGAWVSPKPFKRIADSYHDVPPIDRSLDTPDKANAVFRAGLNLKLRDDGEAYPALVLGNYLLGGSSDSRLWRRIREQEGLSYSVHSWLTAGSLDDVGEFGVSAIYAPQNRARIETEIMDVLRQTLREGFSEDEVAEAKKGYLALRKLRRTQDGALVGQLAGNLYLGRRLAWEADFEARIAALKPEQIRDALKQYLDLRKLSIVKAGDFKRIAKNGGAVQGKN